MSIIERLELEMDRKSLKYTDLADLLKINKSVISNWRSRKTDPPAKYIVLICEFLGVSLSFLLSGKETDDFNNTSTRELIILESISESNLEKVVSYAEFLNYQESKEVECLETKNSILRKKHLQEDFPGKNKEVNHIGDTAAGNAIEAVEGVYFDEKVKVKNKKADFVLTVRGDSMEPKIMDGSLLEVQVTSQVDNGEIAVVKYDGDVTCKKIYTYADRIELHSINKKYSPIIIKLSEYDLENDTFKVLGRALV